MRYQDARAKADIAGLIERARAHREKGIELLEGENGDSRWKGLEQIGHATKIERWIEMLENESDPMWECIARQPKNEDRVSEPSLTKQDRVKQYVLDGEKCRSDRYMNIRPHKGAIEYGTQANARRVSDKPLTFR